MKEGGGVKSLLSPYLVFYFSREIVAPSSKKISYLSPFYSLSTSSFPLSLILPLSLSLPPPPSLSLSLSSLEQLVFMIIIHTLYTLHCRGANAENEGELRGGGVSI